jgi:hypothetical protein
MCHLPPHYKKAEKYFSFACKKGPSKDAKGLLPHPL